jgi:hypothetical protein
LRANQARAGRQRQRQTSWLNRRIGYKPEGQAAGHAWVHSDMLALIARAGLGINPCEVEPS